MTDKEESPISLFIKLSQTDRARIIKMMETILSQKAPASSE